MITVKIQSKTYSDDVLHVVSSVENSIGTLVGAYKLDLPENASDEEIKDAILDMYPH
jgi:hypothetical protein